MENRGQQENFSLKKRVSFSCILTFFTQKRGGPTKLMIPEDSPQKTASFEKKDPEKTTSGSFNYSRENRNFDVFSYIFFDIWIFVDDLVKTFAFQKQKWIAYP